MGGARAPRPRGPQLTPPPPPPPPGTLSTPKSNTCLRLPAVVYGADVCLRTPHCGVIHNSVLVHVVVGAGPGCACRGGGGRVLRRGKRVVVPRFSPCGPWRVVFAMPPPHPTPPHLTPPHRTQVCWSRSSGCGLLGGVGAPASRRGARQVPVSARRPPPPQTPAAHLVTHPPTHPPGRTCTRTHACKFPHNAHPRRAVPSASAVRNADALSPGHPTDAGAPFGALALPSPVSWTGCHESCAVGCVRVVTDTRDVPRNSPKTCTTAYSNGRMALCRRCTDGYLPDREGPRGCEPNNGGDSNTRCARARAHTHLLDMCWVCRLLRSVPTPSPPFPFNRLAASSGTGYIAARPAVPAPLPPDCPDPRPAMSALIAFLPLLLSP